MVQIQNPITKLTNSTDTLPVMIMECGKAVFLRLSTFHNQEVAHYYDL